MQTYQCPTCGGPLAPDSFCPRDGSKAEASKAFGVGSQLDKYLVEEKIGEGGMGEVWRGRHTVINKQVAIKLLNAKFITNPEVMLRFRREALAVNEIRNKHLIDIFDFGELPDGRPYFVMEFLSGKSLATYLEKGPLAFSTLLPLFEQLCRALQAAHDCGIVHRDLKPDNIFLILEEGAAPFVKVLDFGIAKLAGTEEGHGNITRTGAVFGTPSYMSPEQCEGTRTVDHRADIYALGIILCEMLCGRTPFAEPGEGTGVIMAKHIMTPAPPPSQLVSGRNLPASVDAVVLRALAKDPKSRPQRAMDFYSELASAAGNLQGEVDADLEQAKPVSLTGNATSSGGATVLSNNTHTGDYFAGASATKATRPAKVSRFLVAGALLSLLFGSLLTYVVFSGPPEEPSPTAPPLEAKPAASAPLPAPKNIHLSVKASVKSTVLLQSALLGETPLELDIPFSEQEATLRIQSEGYEPKEILFTPKGDYATEVDLKALIAEDAPTKEPTKKENKKKLPKKTVLFSDD